MTLKIDIMNIQQYTVHIKGNIPTMIRDKACLHKEYSDLQFGHGFIDFRGTEKQLDDMLDYLVEQGEADFKILGVYEDNPEEEEYYKQLLTNKNKL